MIFAASLDDRRFRFAVFGHQCNFYGHCNAVRIILAEDGDRMLAAAAVCKVNDDIHGNIFQHGFEQRIDQLGMHFAIPEFEKFIKTRHIFEILLRLFCQLILCQIGG